MAHQSWRAWLVWILKANLVVWAINALVFAVFVLAGFTLANLLIGKYFSMITLLETGAAFLVGGILAFSGSIFPSRAKEYVLKSDEKWSIDKLRESEKRANKFIFLAAILFAESILISVFGI